ncbi:F-box/FBD/LRR-repeat protein At1g13570 isoform X4 [Triticum aestivum]|uniref:F-box/FBD/LRR-repeat protein At1g13570 isoform X4 n=1 Tax=Triticum aestivum TaxID=4565 RepID=UPI001D01C6E3|nr:F-box/FBD/LRR-repeat protein At1g13570-like isoform X4 [Triticum aestivum]
MDDQQLLLGISRSDMLARIERCGRDPAMLDLGSNMLLHFAYEYLPDPPVSPTAPLSLAGASWVPDGVDRISRLPEVLLRDIISRLPAKDAARTAALASRWRPLWRSAPLALVDSHLLPDGGASGPLIIGAASPRAVTAAVSSALAAHPGPFRCVHLTCSTMDEHRGEMARWIDILVAKGVQDLVFVNRPWPVDLRLPATLFSCASLTRLYLGVWTLPGTAAVPRGASFPNLRELGLCMTVMEDHALAFLLERSPVLEFLLIMWSQTGARLRLVSHSLRCLQLGYTHLEDIEVVDAPRLERLFLRNVSLPGTGKFTINSPSRIKIGGAPNLRVLGYIQAGQTELGISNTDIAGSKENIVPSVQILAIEVQFGVRNAVKKVPGFLRCFPNLETLHVHSHPISEESTGKVNVKFWQEGGPIKCILQSMKKVFFYEFRGSRSEVAFLKFVAEKARALEEMVVVVAIECFSLGDDNVSVKLKPLTSAKWNSKACRLELFKSPVTGGSGHAYNHELASDFGFADPFDLKYYKKAGRIPVS